MSTAPVVSFPFDRDFQIGILALMLARHDFLLTGVELFQPEYFEDKILIWFFSTIKNFYEQFQSHPTIDPVLSNELRKAVRSKTVRDTDLADYEFVLKKLQQPVSNTPYTIEEVIRFCRRQAGRKVWLETAPLMETADDEVWDDIVNRISQIPAIGMNHLDIGTNYFQTLQERIRGRENGGTNKRAIPVGITELDLKIGGGLKDGQLGLWLGGTGRGKSIALSHCGKIAVTHGYNVAHYTLELDEGDIAERYDAALTGVPINELGNHTAQVRRKAAFMQERWGHQLRIKHYPTGTASIMTIKQHLRQLDATGWRPDLIIVDYGDLLKPLTNYQDVYADLGAIFKDLRGLAGEMQLPIWSATQSNRVGLVADVIDVEHIADSIQKAFIGDVIIALCATKDEIEKGVLRLFGVKNRNGPDKFTVDICSSYDKMILQDLLREPPPNTTASGSAGAPPPSPLTPAQPKPRPVVRRPKAVTRV